MQAVPRVFSSLPSGPEEPSGLLPSICWISVVSHAQSSLWGHLATPKTLQSKRGRERERHGGVHPTARCPEHPVTQGLSTSSVSFHAVCVHLVLFLPTQLCFRGQKPCRPVSPAPAQGLALRIYMWNVQRESQRKERAKRRIQGRKRRQKRKRGGGGGGVGSEC